MNGKPVAWVATHESGRVLHFAISDGWTVEAVMFDVEITSESPAPKRNKAQTPEPATHADTLDAQRYRWLRDVAWDDPSKLEVNGDWCFAGWQLDAAVDEAMQGRPFGSGDDEGIDG